MKKLYTLLVGLLMLAFFASAKDAQAQYSPSSYSAVVNTDPWVALTGGTTVSELASFNTDFFTMCYKFSNEITLPFNFRYCDLITNKIKIKGNGGVVMGGSATVPDAAVYDYLAYGGYYQLYYWTDYSQFGYVYGSNNTIHAWTGSSFPVKGTYNVQYTTTGSAPNRIFWIEIDGMGNYPKAYDSYYSSTALATYGEDMISYQYELFEGSAFISKIQMNYGPYSGTNGSYYWEYPYNYSGLITALRTTAGTFQDAYLGNINSLSAGQSLTTTTGGYYDNGYYFYNTGPTRNIVWAIRYPFNLSWNNPSASPADQQILLINNAFTPSCKLVNEGQNAITSCQVNCTITQQGVASPVYSQNVTPTGTQIPNPLGNTASSATTFPSFTPTAYGLYTISYTITSTTPAESYTADNTISTSFVVSPPNNVASIFSLIPAPGGRTPVGYATPVSFRYRNMGVNNQQNVPVSVYIKNPQGQVVYRDTVIIPYWSSAPGQQFRDTTFKDFLPQTNGNYTLCGVTLLANDQNHADDTICTSVAVRYLSDVAAVDVLNPDDQEEKPEKRQFRPQGVFASVGVQDLFDVPARCEIHRCSDGVVVFKADSIIPELNTDAGNVKFSFPASQGTNDIAKLAPGCYRVCVIARQGDDGDRTNDTACQVFSIISRLQGTIEVGVGRRFQTISAAVDSMRFRGIGGNLTLVLTDANYTEYGTGSSVTTTPTSFIDFTNIQGTGPTAMVKWVPKTNVAPTITFSGNKQYGMTWDYQSAQYMSWDGNNQIAPSPDALTAEPGKRGITFVNQSTTPGSIFRISHGRSYLTFKNLNLVNNGSLNNNQSRAISIANVYDFNSYNFGRVFDTSEIHHITVDNCFIGNANVAISDSGTVPLFDVTKAFYQDRRNHDNVFSRNTIGSASNPIGAVGIQLTNEDGALVLRNEISNITGASTSSNYVAGITASNGNSINLMLNGNKIHNVTAPNISGSTTAGVDIQQASIIYVTGTGPNQRRSTLPVSTGNRIVNNFVYDLRVNGANTTTFIPMRDVTVGSSTYTVANDSIFNNSIAVADAPAAVVMNHVAKPFLWNNIYQNLNNSANATAVLYNLTVPRPMFSNVSSNNNLIDFRNASAFANMSEYDAATGTSTYAITVPTLNAWRTMSQQDILSVGGDPLFTTDSLHLPIATTYLYTTASNNGAWLGSATQATDIDGDSRVVASGNPDIGADEFDGFQYTNDLSVMTITKPAGIVNTNGVIQVTAENPLAIQAVVKNMGSIIANNRTVTAKTEYSTNNGISWFPLASTTSAPMTWAVGEAKTVDLVGPVITNEATRLFRVTVSVANDQYNANNTQTKVFQILVKRAATLLTYNSSTLRGQQNKDSLAAALQRLGVAYDSLDRNAWGANLIDYSPWWTLVWATGDPTTAYQTVGSTNLGVGSISLKEEQEVINYLKAGQSYAKKSFIVAGQNVAQYLDPNSAFKQQNNVITDAEFMTSWMHTSFVGRWPVQNYPTASPNSYYGTAKGTGVYFVFSDSLWAASPDVIKPNPITGTVGTNTSRFAYFYPQHGSTPSDSGAGTAWNGANFNIVFYAFDWADAVQTVGLRDGEIAPVNVSGTTRFLRGALDFIKSFGGTVLPVEFTNVNGAAKTNGNLISWSVAGQKDIDRYEVEMLGSDNTWNWAGTVKATSTDNYSFLHSAESALETGKSYTYRVAAVNLDGSRQTSGTVNVERTAEGASFAVAQNFPNPFTVSTTIGYSLPEAGTVSIRVLDLTGKVVTVAVDGQSMTAGQHNFTFNANELASGTYIYEVSFTNADGQTSVMRNKMTLNK
ncbi:MAG: T9SS type A sorting domain-containing protein [Bacteroidetes bacterium]|nr:T9SS type A sorting domain-containing protein [Bacteroidota bacterium]